MVDEFFKDVLELSCNHIVSIERDIMGKSIMPDPLNAKIRYECIIHFGENKLTGIKFDRFRIEPSQMDDFTGYNNRLMIYFKDNTKCRLRKKSVKYIGEERSTDEWELKCGSKY